MVKVLMALVLASGVAVAQDEAKKKAGPLVLPTSAELKEKCGLDDAQVVKVDEVLASYKDKIAAAQEKVKSAEDKKAAMKEAGVLRTEIAGKLVELGKDEEQKKKLTEATAAPERKKKKTT